jgi:hypothetical protein
MKYPERTEIVSRLPYESRLGFIAFCVERCLREAELHLTARAQLEDLPLLREGLEMLWARAERGVPPNPERVNAILSHVETYEAPHPSMESVVYNFDISLVQAARMLKKGMKALLDSNVTPRYVAGAFEGAVQSVGVIYAHWEHARNMERNIADTALERLRDLGSQPFSRAVLESIPDWTRGDLSPKYAEGRLKGSAEDDE